MDQLLNKLKKGDESAFKELVLTYSKRLMTTAKMYSQSIEDAEDILQDAFIIIFQKINQFKGAEESMFFAWMKRIIINLSISKKRKFSYKLEGKLDPLEHDQSFDANILGAMHQDDLMNIIFKLPNGYRQVFALFAIEGYSHKEISERLSIKESTSRSQFLRAKRMLQEKIRNQFKVAAS